MIFYNKPIKIIIETIFARLFHFNPVYGTIELPQTGWLSGGS